MSEKWFEPLLEELGTIFGNLNAGPKSRQNDGSSSLLLLLFGKNVTSAKIYRKRFRIQTLVKKT